MKKEKHIQTISLQFIVLKTLNLNDTLSDFLSFKELLNDPWNYMVDNNKNFTRLININSNFPLHIISTKPNFDELPF